MNPVEVMYAAMPTLLVINPKYIFYLLRPMLDFGLLRSKNDYAPPDLGLDYPNAVGNDADASIFGIDSKNHFQAVLPGRSQPIASYQIRRACFC